MTLRHKKTGKTCYSDTFNTHSMNEVIVYYDDDCDSAFIEEFDVELGIGDATYWKDLRQAFKDRDVITNNHNTRFFEPATLEDRARGYTI